MGLTESLGNLIQAMFGQCCNAIDQIQAIEMQLWRESECLYLGITEDQLNQLIEIDTKMAAAGFNGWYEIARSIIIESRGK